MKRGLFVGVVWVVLVVAGCAAPTPKQIKSGEAGTRAETTVAANYGPLTRCIRDKFTGSYSIGLFSGTPGVSATVYADEKMGEVITTIPNGAIGVIYEIRDTGNGESNVVVYRADKHGETVLFSKVPMERYLGVAEECAAGTKNPGSRPG